MSIKALTTYLGLLDSGFSKHEQLQLDFSKVIKATYDACVEAMVEDFYLIPKIGLSIQQIGSNLLRNDHEAKIRYRKRQGPLSAGWLRTSCHCSKDFPHEVELEEMDRAS